VRWKEGDVERIVLLHGRLVLEINSVQGRGTARLIDIHACQLRRCRLLKGSPYCATAQVRRG